MSELGYLLKKLRGKRTLRNIADITGLSHSYISDLEKGMRRGTLTPLNPSPDTLKMLAKAYDYPYEDLLKVAGYLEEEKLSDEYISENKRKAIEELNKMSDDDIDLLLSLIDRINEK